MIKKREKKSVKKIREKEDHLGNSLVYHLYLPPSVRVRTIIPHTLKYIEFIFKYIEFIEKYIEF